MDLNITFTQKFAIIQVVSQMILNDQRFSFEVKSELLIQLNKNLNFSNSDYPELHKMSPPQAISTFETLSVQNKSAIALMLKEMTNRY